jgi:hypothetical protein
MRCYGENEIQHIRGREVNALKLIIPLPQDNELLVAEGVKEARRS